MNVPYSCILIQPPWGAMIRNQGWLYYSPLVFFLVQNQTGDFKNYAISPTMSFPISLEIWVSSCETSCNAVRPLESLLLVSAPRFNRRLTTSYFPNKAASCKAVPLAPWMERRNHELGILTTWHHDVRDYGVMRVEIQDAETCYKFWCHCRGYFTKYLKNHRIRMPPWAYE